MASATLNALAEQDINTADRLLAVRRLDHKQDAASTNPRAAVSAATVQQVTSPSRSRAYAVLRQQRRETASPNGPAGHWPTWKPTARPDTRPLKATRRRFCSGRCRTAAKTGRAAAPARALQARPRCRYEGLRAKAASTTFPDEAAACNAKADNSATNTASSSTRYGPRASRKVVFNASRAG